MTLAEPDWDRESGDAEVDWPLLIGKIQSGKVIPIVGPYLYTAGTTAPSFDQAIASQIAREFKINGASQDCTLREVVLQALRGRGNQPWKVHKRIRELIDGVDHEPEPLEQLARISDFRLFVTTGYDRLLQLALQRARSETPANLLSYSLSGKREDLSIARAAAPTVYHLFGTTADGCWTEAEILEHLHFLIANLQPRLLLKELNNSDLLFLGCGFSDWLARFFIRIMNGRPFEPSDRPPRHFVVDRHVSKDPGLRLFLSHHNFAVIEHANAAQFVATLYREWLAARPDPAEQDRPAMVPEGRDVVFLSYCRLDRDIVQPIAEALQRARLPVFFDENDIAPGSKWRSVIRRNLESTRLFVPFISHNTETAERRFFWSEWRDAADMAREYSDRSTFIVPVAIDPIEPHDANVPNEFREPQWYELHDRTRTGDFVEVIVRLYRNAQRPGRR